MEYRCKNAKNESPVAVQLGNFSMTLSCEGQTEEIRYAEIVSVEVVKLSGVYYSLSVKTLDEKSLTVTNRYHHADGKVEDKSTSYGLFVRVLHMHLNTANATGYRFSKKSYLRLHSLRFLFLRPPSVWLGSTWRGWGCCWREQLSSSSRFQNGAGW